MLTRISSVNKAFIHDALKFHLLRGRQVHLKDGTMKNINKEQLGVNLVRVVDLRSNGRLFDTLRRHCFLSLSMTLCPRQPGTPSSW